MQDFIEDPGLRYKYQQKENTQAKIAALIAKRALQEQEFQAKYAALQVELQAREETIKQEYPAALRKATNKLKAANNKLSWELKQASKAAPMVVAQKEEKSRTGKGKDPGHLRLHPLFN